MPRKRGLLSRLLGRLTGKSPGPPEPPRPPDVRTPPPVPPPATPPADGGGDGEGRFRAIWNRETRGYRTSEGMRPSFRDHFELFISLPGVTEEPPDEQLHLWRVYIQTMVTGVDDRRVFENEFGVNLRQDFDWDDWRAAMNYKRRAA